MRIQELADMAHEVEQVRQAAAKATEVAVRDERDAIMAYLRAQADVPRTSCEGFCLEDVADKIEQGAHHES